MYAQSAVRVTWTMNIESIQGPKIITDVQQQLKQQN
jgi:hypothetical protein